MAKPSTKRAQMKEESELEAERARMMEEELEDEAERALMEESKMKLWPMTPTKIR